jgi:hypothetical protein
MLYDKIFEKKFGNTLDEYSETVCNILSNFKKKFLTISGEKHFETSRRS